jgi:hypothetical protein
VPNDALKAASIQLHQALIPQALSPAHTKASDASAQTRLGTDSAAYIHLCELLSHHLRISVPLHGCGAHLHQTLRDETRVKLRPYRKCSLLHVQVRHRSRLRPRESP